MKESDIEDNESEMFGGLEKTINVQDSLNQGLNQDSDEMFEGLSVKQSDFDHDVDKEFRKELDQTDY